MAAEATTPTAILFFILECLPEQDPQSLLVRSERKSEDLGIVGRVLSDSDGT